MDLFVLSSPSPLITHGCNHFSVYNSQKSLSIQKFNINYLAVCVSLSRSLYASFSIYTYIFVYCVSLSHLFPFSFCPSQWPASPCFNMNKYSLHYLLTELVMTT